MRYKGVIFDFNGVLLWDAPLHEYAWQVMAERLRGVAFSDEELRTHMHGRTNGQILGYVTGHNIEGTELQELIQTKESMYRNLCLQHPEMFVLSPGAVELLDMLVERDIPRTIATSSEKTNLDFFLKHLDLGRWFDPEAIVYDNGLLAGKPAPDMYLRAASNLGLLPQDCIVVEDAISGLKAARAAGIGHILGLGPVGTHASLLACDGVSAVIENLMQFPFAVLPERVQA